MAYKPVHPEQDPKIINALRNPLADYKLQLDAESEIQGSTTIGDSSLSGDIRLGLVGLDDDTPIHYAESRTKLPYARVMDSAKNRKLIMSLNPNAQKVFLWIVFSLDYRDETVTLDLTKMIKLGFKMSMNTFSKSLKQLEEKKVIQRIGLKAGGPNYWLFHINPQLIWKGDAVKYFNDLLMVHPDYFKPLSDNIKPIEGAEPLVPIQG